jgi:hypothetical protein
MSFNVKQIQKEVNRLEAELARAKRVLAAASGEEPSGKARKTKASGKTAKKAVAKPAKAAGRAPKRALSRDHLETVLAAIGERLPAVELKGKIDGRVLRALPLKQALKKLRDKDLLTTEGEKRLLVYIRTAVPVSVLDEPKAVASEPTETPISNANGASEIHAE